MRRSSFGKFVLLFISFFCLVISSCSDGYKSFPKEFDPDKIIKSIKPDENYTFWAYCRWPGGDNPIIYSRGKKPENLKLDSPIFGNIYQGCQPAYCCNYIFYVKDRKAGYISRKDDFAKFLGHIDNLEEAVLLATATQDVYIDGENSMAGAYKVENGVYNLRLAHYRLCPETKTSYFIRIDKNKGIIEKTKLQDYYKSKNCLIY